MSRLDDYKLVQSQWYRYTQTLANGHAEYQKLAQVNENFYLGGGLQWDEQVKLALEELGKPWLELNLIFSTINAVIGTQTQSRMDIAFKPREDGDQQISELLTKIAMYILDRNKYSWKETDVFSDGLIQQRGYFDIRVEVDENLKGEISIEHLDPLNVIPDPSANSYDPDDWADVMIEKWMTLDEIKLIYGIKAYRNVSRNLDLFSTNNFNEFGVLRNTFSSEYSSMSAMPYFEQPDGTVYIKVVERQWWKLTNRKYFVDQSGEMIPVSDDMKPREIKAVARENGYDVITRLVKRVRWTVTTKDVLLFDSWSPYEHFTIVPYFPYFRRGKTRGLVDNLTKTQEMLNKVFSQILHIVNSTSNSGWILEEDSLSNMTIDDLEDEGSRTGLILEFKKGSIKPDKIQPNQIPTGLKDLVNSAVELLNTISGVTQTFKGEQGNEVSGAAIQSRVAQTAVQLAVPIDNLFKTRNLIAHRLMELIQGFYTEHRVFNIVSDEVREGEKVQEQIEINKVNDIGEIINDITVGKFDVVVADVPTQVTYQNAQFAQALEMRKFGVNIPDDEMVLLSTLSRKNEIAKKINPQPSEEEIALQNKNLQLELAQKEEEIEKLKAETKNKKSDAYKKAAEVAEKISENPSIATLLDKILAEESNQEQEQSDAEVQQQVLGQVGDVRPGSTEAIPPGSGEV